MAREIKHEQMNEKTKRRFNRIARLYDIFELPFSKKFSRLRKRLVQNAEGRTLEVGIGTGNNIPFYPGIVELTGIDLSDKMISIAQKKSKGGTKIDLQVMDAENMLFEDNSFDTVVSFGTLCSIPDPDRGLKEIRRVCRDGGKILMLEHVRSNNKIAGKMMDLINPLTRRIIGDNINRRTYENILNAGFSPRDIVVEDIGADIIKLFQITNNKAGGD